MSITDLTSMGEPQTALRNEINDRLCKLQDEISDYCFQCAKCTSGCEAHKLLELEPHKMVALLKRGLIDEMINSDVIWTCMSCFKCRERCPQKVAPVEILFALKNIAVLIISMFLFLLCAEVLTRAIAGKIPVTEKGMGIRSSNPLLLYELKPNYSGLLFNKKVYKRPLQ